MREYGSNINLPSLDNLFSSEQERQDAKLEKIQILPLTELHPFRNHPFQVRDDDEMDKMVDSVKEYGVMTPAIVRPRKDGGYEIVAGHRRCHASQRAGVETMPCIVRDMDDDTAIILMVDSNCQREHLSFGNEYHARLAGSGTYSTQLGADVLGNLTRLSNLANGIEPSIEKTRNMQIQLEQQLASAEEEVKRPFPQATELTEKSKRLAVLEGLLNMNDKDIVTDTEPEQQYQTDNRQRGQEER